MSDIALDTSVGVDVRRRRLAQSEGAFRKAIDMGRPPIYMATTDWLISTWAGPRVHPRMAKPLTISRKAEEIVSEGLRYVRTRESLWIISAEIYEWLGDHPAALSALQAAVDSTLSGGALGSVCLGPTLPPAGRLRESEGSSPASRGAVPWRGSTVPNIRTRSVSEWCCGRDVRRNASAVFASRSAVSQVFGDNGVGSPTIRWANSPRPNRCSASTEREASGSER